eukprot:TRINITY_DN4488_c0_g1_i2.p1 TRINITY_DN4488_c0_g1~~TRINITY_DN4488_c0_g1_i2.p1  ORF type:complete len:1740 (+),score=308.01 TRINITY_DN4488_c0_g1_i2:97-5220(+)
MTAEQADDTISKLRQNRIYTVSELAAFSLDKLPVLKLKPKARSILRTVIPKLAESFRLKELFGVLPSDLFSFINCDCDCEAVADALQKKLEIDSWSSFLELENEDLLEIEELKEDMRKELLELIHFAKEFDKQRFLRDMENLRNRRAHTTEDSKDILAAYDNLNVLLNRALVLASQGVPIGCSEQDLSGVKEQLKNDRAVFEEQLSQTVEGEDDTNNELVSFSDTFGDLYMNDVLLEELRSKFSQISPSHVVTFVGATHVGKSTMIRHMTAPGQKVPAVAARNNYYPTTGNVHIYHTNMNHLDKSCDPCDVNMIDIEGSNSPSIPKYVLNTFTSQIKKLMSEGGQSIIDKRRKAVNQHLPRFAYVISDVIVYIGEGSWANTEYRDNVIAFANAAVENVASAIRPCLVIIHNKCNLHEPMDVDVLTKKFLVLHEGGEESPVLTKLYDSVVCISIPDWYHDHDLFDQQVGKLKKIVAGMLLSQQMKRQRLGCLLTQVQWIDLIKYVVDNFTSKSLRIGTFVGELVSPENSLAKNAFQFFNSIYDGKRAQMEASGVFCTGEVARDCYLMCREFAIEKLALLLLAALRQETHTSAFVQQPEGPIVGDAASLQHTQFRNEVLDSQLTKWYHILEVMTNFMQSRMPCCAVYKGVKDDSGNAVVCTQECGQHDTHRSAAMVYSPSADEGFLESFLNGIKRFLGIKIPSVWEGDFDFGAMLPNFDEDKELLRKKIESLYSLDSRAFFIETLELIRKATNGINPAVPEESCYICQANSCNRRLVPCGHAFCEFCVDKLKLIGHPCPVCQKPLERVVQFVELSNKVGKVITTNGIVAVQEQLVKLVPSPFKIISVVGKIPHTHKKVIDTLESIKSISDDRINPLLNFAFCSRFTGHKTCMYVEGENPKLVVVHYAVDRYFDRPCIYPYLTSDVVVLLDNNFLFKLPEGFPHYPLVIEPVTKQTRVRLPHRLTPLIMIHYLSPPSSVSLLGDVEKAIDEKGRDRDDYTANENEEGVAEEEGGRTFSVPSDIPPDLSKKHSRYTLVEWSMYVQEIMSVSPDYLQTFVCGADSILKKRLEYFLYGTTMTKSIHFLQMVEKKYSYFYDFISQLTLINSVAAASASRTSIQESSTLILEMLAMCKCYLVGIMVEAREYYNGSLLPPFMKQINNSGNLFPHLAKEELVREAELIELLKTRLQTSETHRVITARRLLMYKNLLQKPHVSPHMEQSKEKWPDTQKAIIELLGKNTQYCLLCMEEMKEQLTKLSCNHQICKRCWTDIHWLDDHQAPIADLLDINNYTGNGGYSLSPSSSGEASSELSPLSSSTLEPSSSASVTSPTSSGSLPTLAPTTRSASVSSSGMHSGHVLRSSRRDSVIPEGVSGGPYKRQLLLFRCPVCDEFQLERLRQYIWTDVNLSKAHERSVRMLCTLDEAEEGKVFLHRPITSRELTQLEPITDSVFRARYNNGSGPAAVAVKFFKPYHIGFEWSRFRREVAILRMCEHPHIVGLVGAYVPTEREINSENWRDNNTLIKPFIVLEYLPDTLSEVIRTANRSLPITTSLLYCYQIASAIHFLHSLGVVHRDLKPANVVISQESQVAKLIDFGESRILKNQERLTKVGTPFYEAPEIVKGNYNEKVDSYSFGKMVYEIVTKSLNPAGLANRDFYDRFTIDQVTMQLEELAEEFKHFIVACCQPTPHARPDFEVLSKYLYDYYLQFTTHN